MNLRQRIAEIELFYSYRGMVRSDAIFELFQSNTFFFYLHSINRYDQYL